ncbi:NDP-sugar epimerase, includes UDP-GlcNAc-inverting 4,6-dehydratase FlaA1 and capsular polysaccharide biosynthesis protein EpsC [Salipiger thiooxidans]|uniref:NDP-sugar epimerase, includes UDP-GlcNAc-inverting 4,6-dehydratase FlaA1 and capsular polysaccharide biosynthesis protein EpsC n=2 Tax=Salipiger TaxID=263377 RepID=A0A1G7E3A9_9RHOB|nr:nucleoside-diphosphate sugar epimerase/dehydratase [Salipiger thiooxidans]SDE58197.1 NDP-sugar epimerase, includes UDP-GlcNAc-inverting 4,6-dehydratase FlaA1 and capsular polysaccharide biosynthesis protein EpsC [Salipiger thiooxidans]
MLYRLVTSLTRTQKQWLFMLMDAGVIAIAMISAMALNAAVNPDLPGTDQLIPMILGLVVTGSALSWWFGLPRFTLNAYDTRGIVRTAGFALVCGGFGGLFNGMIVPPLSLAVYFNFSLLLLVLAASWRILLRYATIEVYRRGMNRMRVLIYGAGQTGQQLAAALRHDHAIEPVAFVDDNPTLQSQVIAGLRVHAPSAIKELIARKGIERVVLAMPSISQPQLARIAHRLRLIGCEVHALPSFAELVGERELKKRVSPVSLDDLLGRNRLEAELPGVSHAYSGRRILVTGAGGSIGSELCRQLIACKPDCVVLVDHSELGLYNIDKELRDIAHGMTIVPILGSVLNEQLMAEIMQEHRIEVVLHAAAYKHLPLVECNVLSGLNNNVIGTKVLADIAREAGVERFILVSSDKAVRPTNVMGASKRLAELVVQDLATRSAGTRFSMVRFGNVLGSSGSVIPLFEEQIARGGPVTLTDPKVTRYFMTVSEAARLVLLAGSFARGGDVFVLDMGDPVPIKKLARQMIEGAGYTVRDAKHPDGDIEIEITGLRRGEKLHEELLISPDMLTTPHHKILRAQESYLSEFEIATALKDLRSAIAGLDEDMARSVIARWVERCKDAEQTAQADEKARV